MGWLEDRYKRTTLGARRHGADRKTAARTGFKKSIDPLQLFTDQEWWKEDTKEPGPDAVEMAQRGMLSNQKPGYAKGGKVRKSYRCGGKVAKKMKKGGRATCRGMGAATRGGSYKSK